MAKLRQTIYTAQDLEQEELNEFREQGRDAAREQIRAKGMGFAQTDPSCTVEQRAAFFEGYKGEVIRSWKH